MFVSSEVSKEIKPLRSSQDACSPRAPLRGCGHDFESSLFHTRRLPLKRAGPRSLSSNFSAAAARRG